MEIERKYVIHTLPKGYDAYPYRIIEQGYLSTAPVVRVRRDNDDYVLTYKSKGFLAREEYNLPLTEDSYQHLLKKADGRLIRKRRYVIPLTDGYSLSSPAQSIPECDGLFIELDIFENDLAPLMLAEVEFPDRLSAENFLPPSWFGEDVTYSEQYQNSRLSRTD